MINRERGRDRERRGDRSGAKHICYARDVACLMKICERLRKGGEPLLPASQNIVLNEKEIENADACGLLISMNST